MADQVTGPWQKLVSDADLFLEDLEKPSSSPSDEKPPSLLERKRWLFERRLEYGVEFFKFHADQRMKMFNFFILFVGLFGPAYATLLTNGHLLDSSFLAFMAAVLTFGFVHMEHRNEELVHIAEDVLASLEADVLFAKYTRSIPWPRRRTFWGTMGQKDLTKRQVGIFQREAADIYGPVRSQRSEPPDGMSWPRCPQSGDDDGKPNPSPHEHGKWLPRLQKGILVMFVFLAIFPWLPPQVRICGHPITLRVEGKK